MKVQLEVIEGSRRGERFQFTSSDVFVVGRAQEAHLRLADDAHISRHHCLVEINPPSAFVRDLGSANGTYVNGQRVTSAVLRAGDVIASGATRIRFQVDAEAASETVAYVPTQEHAAKSAVVAVGQQAEKGRQTGGSDPLAGLVEQWEQYRQRGIAIAPEELCRAQPELLTALRERLGTLAAVNRWRTTTGSEGQPQPAALAPPVIHGFEFVRELGRGGMGAVHLARRKSNGQQVAIKVIASDAAASESSVRRFLREASVLSQLNHRRIVRFEEIGMAHGEFYFVMEFVEAVDPRKLMAQRGAESRVKAFCGIACQMLEGLRYAHERSFVHRDIKPSNVLVSQSGRRLRTKLADFGLAKNFHAAGFSNLTREGQTLGTLAFMAPEQITHSRDVTPSVDLYATAATLYYLLCGQTAHDFPAGLNPLVVILEHEIVPLQTRWPEVSPALARVVHRALARRPEDRYPSAQRMYHALVPFAAGVGEP